jgi:hypothetical protein
MGAGRDLFALRKDGTEVPVEIALTPIGKEDALQVLVSIVDITERKKMEAERDNYTAALKVQVDLLRARLKSAQDLTQDAVVIAAALEKFTQKVGSE